jgi:energy-converting hydrogenase B subunit D
VTVLQLVALVGVMLGGTAVVITAEPLRQTIVLGVFGLMLTFLFFTFQAPDVALSEIVVSSVGLPIIVLAALRKIRQQEHRRAEQEEEAQE